ncbi:MAG: Ubiquinone/menaquinone biosynthesis C-methyltransferase UbiE [Chlamydiae bacterium]|nr:Ubiquinone/menaquinone biosynthesis C-methyltransferase UbiE [Chlamydiota bacterium]
MKRKKADMEELMLQLIQEWRRFTKLGGPPDVLQTREFRRVVESLRVMREAFDSAPQHLGRNYFSNFQLLADYLLYYWPLHYQEALSILSELPTTPRRVLDICSGPCPVAFAALKLGCSEVFAVDQNLEALNLGARICGREGYPITIRKWNPHTQQLPVEGKFDLITMGYCLEELFPQTEKGWQDEQDAFIDQMLNLLNPNGYLVILDSSLPEKNQRVLNIRERFVKKKIPVQAPCVWRGECPALANNFPCFAQREYEKPYVMKEFQRALNINLGSLKVSYLILRHPSSGWPQLPDKDYFRVVSPPSESPQGKQFYLCGTPGKRKICSRKEELPKESRAFQYLKRGELISVEDALEKHNTLHIKDETKITVEAACGKPIPEVF